MTLSRTIHYPVVLTRAEMAFLLSLTGVQTLIGLEDKGLFPADTDGWQALFLQGRAELESHGWLEQRSGSVQTQINEELLIIIATIAAPRRVLVTTLDSPNRPAQSVTHYLASRVVEASFDGARYHLATLASPDIMVARLAATLELPVQPPPWDEFMLSRERAKKAAADPQPEQLVQMGVPPASALPFARALHSERRARLQMLHLNYGQVETSHRFNALLGEDQDDWFVLPANGAGLRVCPASAPALAEQIKGLW
ncbi:MAG: hypothetical protein ABTQ73_08940 [Caldilineales bacterium]